MSPVRNLTQAQKMDMVMKGLSPINPEHVQTYIQNRGAVRASMQEQTERLSTLIGNDVYRRNDLGSGKESERDLDMAYQKTGLIDTPSRAATRDPRQMLAQDMEGYYSNKGMNSIDSSRLLSLRESSSVSQPQAQPITTNVKQAYQLGYKSSITYLNAFIINVKNPSINSRMQLFKELRKIMEIEQKLKGKPDVLGAFRKGLDKGETEMYNKLKG